jgi:hypothetical protein
MANSIQAVRISISTRTPLVITPASNNVARSLRRVELMRAPARLLIAPRLLILPTGVNMWRPRSLRPLKV